MSDHRRSSASGLVFISAGIPEDDWADAPFQRHEITQAVVAVTVAALQADGSILFGGHPLITPLVYEVADSVLDAGDERTRVVLYQSTYFADALPETVWSFREKPWSTVVDVERVGFGAGDLHASLDAMRGAMLDPIRPIAAAVFIGGKPGVVVEYELFRRQHPDAPCFPLARPGGSAGDLAPANVDDELAFELQSSAAYGHLARRIMAAIRSQ